MKRRKKAIRNIGTIQDGDKPVRVWMRLKDGAVLFRKKGSQKVTETNLREIWEHLTGQLKMPFI
jgi:hypothetical protein